MTPDADWTMFVDTGWPKLGSDTRRGRTHRISAKDARELGDAKVGAAVYVNDTNMARRLELALRHGQMDAPSLLAGLSPSEAEAVVRIAHYGLLRLRATGFVSSS